MKLLNKIISIILIITLLVGIAPMSSIFGVKTSLGDLFSFSAEAARPDYSGLTPNQYLSNVLLYHNYNGVYASDGLSVYRDLIKYEDRVAACIATRNEVQSGLRTLDFLYNALTFKPSNITDHMLGKWEIYAGIIIDLIGKQISDHTLMDSVNCAENKFIISATKQLMGAAKNNYEINEIMNLGGGAKLTKSQKNAITEVLNNNNDYRNLDFGGEILDGISNGIKYATTLMDTISLVASIKSIGEISEALSDTLDKMYAKASDEDLKYAIFMVKTYLAQHSFTGMLGIGASKLINDAVGSILDSAWNIVVNSAVGGPIGTAISVGQALGSAVSSFCFSTEAAKDKLIVCYAMEDVEKAIAGAVKSFESTYKSNDSIANADNFMMALQLLTKAYPLHYDYCADFWYTAYSKGALSWLYKNRNLALNARNEALKAKEEVSQWKQVVYLEGAYKEGYKYDAPEGYNNYFKSLSENGLGQITTEQLDAVRSVYGYETGKYWTYTGSKENRKKGFKASSRKGRNYSYYYNGVECYGFANFVMSKVTGTNVYPGNGNKNGWVKLSPSEVTELRIGDIVRIGKNDSNGHSGIVYTNNNGKCTFLQCLGGVDNKITVGKALAGTKALNNGYKNYSMLSAMKNDNALVYVYRYTGSIIGNASRSNNNATEYNPSAAYSAGEYKVIAKSGLSIRESPSKQSKKLGGYSYGAVVTVSTTNGNWGYTSRGWICLDYTSKLSSSASVNTHYNGSASFSTGSYVVTAKEGLRIRQSPTAASKRLGAYKYNTVVDVLATNGNWGQTDKGWICLDYTRFIAPLKSETFHVVNYEIGVYKANDPAGLNYRDKPGQNNNKLGTIAQNTEFEVVTIDGSWGYCNELGGWLCLNYAEYVRALPVRLPVPSAPALTSSTPSELPVDDIITVDWSVCDYADSYTASLIDASNNKVIETKDGITNTSVSFVTPYAGTFNIHVVSVNAQHESPIANINGFEAKAPVTVTFKDWNDEVLCKQTIKYGTGAVAPSDPERTGYTFAGWSGEYTSVRSDMEVTANYTRNSYTVTFYDYNGTTVLDTQNVLFGDGAVEPSYSVPSGYSFLRWDTDFSCITEDTNVKAVVNWNSQFPLEISTFSSIYRDNTNYITTSIVNNSPNSSTNAKVIVSLKTAEGKELAEAVSPILVFSAGEVKTLTLTAQYDGAATVGDIFVVRANDENIPVSKHLIVPVDAGSSWSTWSTNTPPADALETESRTEYRYKTKSFKTSSEPDLEGWTMFDTSSAYSAWSNWSEWQDTDLEPNDLREVKTQTVTDTSNITWGEWSGWQDAPITESALCQVETQEVVASHNYKTQYNYSRYAYIKNGAVKWCGPTNGTWNGYRCSTYQEKGWLDSKLTYVRTDHTNQAGTVIVYSDGGTYHWYNEQTREVVVSDNYKTQYRCRIGTYGTKTQYSYRTRSLNTTYSYYKWSDWSDWTTEAQTGTDDIEVNTRTTYRYVSNNASNIEDRSGVLRTISGNLGEAYSGKNALLHIFSEDKTTQYIGQTTINNDGSYSFTFKLKNEPSAASGDYTVALSIGGSTKAIELEPILAPDPIYTVTFKNADGSIIETQQINKGESAVVPDAPVITGHIFTGWDNSCTNIQCDTVITATYEKETFDIVFVDEINGTIETKTFAYGDTLEYPEISQVSDAYTFLGWDAALDGRTTVEDNMVINAVYEKKYYTVNFYGYDNSILASFTVEYGDGIVAPEPEEDGIRNFIAWNNEAELNYITDNLDVYPIYDYLETVATPVANINTGSYETPQTVTLSCETDGAMIYYTLDGSDPLSGSSVSDTGTLYTQPFTLDSSADLTFVAVKDGMNNSSYESAVYAINTASTQEAKYLVTVHYGLDNKEYSLLVKNGDPVNLPDPTENETGYNLIGIYTDEAYTNPWNPETDVVTDDINLYLLWKEKEYTVTFLDLGGVVISTQTIPLLGSAISLTAPEEDGFTFVGWDTDYYSISSDLTVNATYVENESVTNISLSDNELILQNEITTAKLTASVALAPGSTNDHVIWKSDNEAIATVDDNGNITFHNDGTVIIFAIAEDSGMSAKCIATHGTACAHTMVETLPESPATCTMDGYSDSVRCCNCNTIIEEPIPIPATGHAYGEWTKLDNVQHQRVCANDASHVEKQLHDWDDGVFETVDEYPANSIKTYTCSVCSAKKHEYVVKYDAQGGSGAPAQQIKQEGVDLTLSSVRPTKPGYTFVGWSIRQDSVVVNCSPGSVYSEDAPLTLYALYKSDDAEVFWGDVNGDGEISSLDAQLVLKFYAGSKIPTQEQKLMADVDFSGKIDSSDAKYILKDEAGKLSEYPAEKLAEFSFTTPVKLIYNVGEELDTTGMQIVAANKNDSSISYAIDESIVLSGYDKDQLGIQTVTAAWRAKTFTFPITVQCTHTWDDGVVTTPATTAEEGVRTFTCTVCGATRAESIPKALAKIAVTAANAKTGIKLTWKKDANADGYYVFRKTGTGSYSTLKKIEGNDTLSFIDTTVTWGTKYIYGVRSYRGSEKGAYTAKAITALKAITPTLANGKTGMTLTWTKVAGADGYYVFRKTGSGSYTTLKKIVGNETLTYTDTTAVSGTKYTYGVRAYKSTTKGAYTAKSMTRLAALTPTLTNASGGVEVTWTKVAGADGYYVFRKTGTGSYTTLKKIVGADTLTFTDTTAVNGTKYTYGVRAYKSTTKGAYTAKATYRMTGVAISSVTNSAAGKLTVKYAKNAGATGYEIQYATNSSFTSAKTVTVTDVSTLSKTIASLTKGTTYYVRVRAYKTVSSVKYYSAWSAAKSVKIVK